MNKFATFCASVGALGLLATGCSHLWSVGPDYKEPEIKAAAAPLQIK